MPTAKRKRKVAILPAIPVRISGCRRCGYCCLALNVAVLREEDGVLVAYHKPAGVVCPHLSGMGTSETICAAHDAPWYVRTPCFARHHPELDPDAVDWEEWSCMGPRLVHLALGQARSPGWAGLERLSGAVR